MTQTKTPETLRQERWVATYRQRHPVADRWAAGYGVVQHSLATQAHIFTMAEHLAATEVRGDGVPVFELLYTLDRVTSAAL